MKLKGYAAHFNRANKNRERVSPEAFDTSINEFIKGNRTIPINVNHDNTRIVGKVTSMTTDAKGLFIECELIDGVAEVQESIKPLIEGEVFRYFSTEGYAYDIDYKDDDTYLVNNFDIRAVAICTAPADVHATFVYSNKANTLHILDAFDVKEEPTRRLSIYKFV